MNLDTIKKNYARMNNIRLLELANAPKGLAFEVLPLLREELEKRGYEKEAHKITEYLEKSDSETQEEVLGDEFKEHGLRIFQVIAEEEKEKGALAETIMSLKEEGLSEEEIKQKMKREHDLDQQNFDEIKSSQRMYGRIQKRFGIGVAIIGFVIFLIMLDGRTFFASPFLLLLIGLSLFLNGKRKIKLNK